MGDKNYTEICEIPEFFEKPPIYRSWKTPQFAGPLKEDEKNVLLPKDGTIMNFS